MKSWKIAIACFMGGFIGSFVALEVSHTYWWVGLIIGAIVGYVSYEFKEIPTTARKVWHAMPERKIVNHVLLATGQCFGILVLCLLLLGGLGVCVNIGLGSMLNAFNLEYHFFFQKAFVEYPPVFSISEMYWYTAFMIVCASISYVLFCEEENEVDRVIGSVIIMSSSPFVSFVTVPIIALAICAGLGWCISKICPILWKLVAKTFRIVHSDIRILCMVDSAIGTLIGYLCGNAMIGGILGASLGVLNYQLVSVRWLKLVPAKVKS